MRTPEPRPYLMGDTVADKHRHQSDMAEWADRPQEYPALTAIRDEVLSESEFRTAQLSAALYDLENHARSRAQATHWTWRAR
jgi:hypothetical protein